jgi:uncharacterized protein YciI
MLWVIVCTDNPDTAPVRAEHLAPHRAYLASQNDKLVLAGATLSDDGAAMTGSCFVLNVQSREEAEEFSQGDPFTQAGIFKSVCVRRMRKGQWNPETAEGA